MAQKTVKAAYLGIFGNLFLALLKGVTGFFGQSNALIADAIESLTDVFSSVLVLAGVKYAEKPADENHPYGHGKIEPLVTFGIVGFLLIAATIVAYSSIINIQSYQTMPKPFTLYVLLGIILIKETLYRIVKKRSAETGSGVLKAEAVHHRMDAITSLLAFLGISLALYMGPGYEAADDWAALLASVIIVINAYLLFRPALAEVMDEHRYDEMVHDIREIAEEFEDVIGPEKCLVRKTGMIYHVDLHIVVSGKMNVFDSHEIAHQVKNRIIDKMPEICDVIIHVEPDDEKHVSKIKRNKPS